MDRLARWATDTPDAPFLIAAADSVDFATAHDRVGRLAGAIRSRFEPGTRLGVVMSPGVDEMLLSLAVPRAGSILVPLAVGVPAAEQRSLVESAGVSAVLDPSGVGEAAPLAPRIDPSATHSAIFTSGSTGAARPVRLTWENIEASAAASAAHLQHRADDRWLAVLPFHHVGGLSILWRSVREGSAVVLGGRFVADRVAALLQEGTVTLASFVSPMLEGLADAGLERAPGFRLGLVGGGPASERALSVGGMRLLPTYGMTETASQVATADPADPRPDSLVVLDGVNLDVRADHRIIVDGPMVSPGYLDASDRTGPLVTGDVGRLADGRLEVLGRADELIVTGGENVMPLKVERAIGALEGAGEVAVVGVADSRWGAVVAAAFTGPADPERLRSLLEGQLARHEIPRRWLRVDALPRLGIGKIDRSRLAGLFE